MNQAEIIEKTATFVQHQLAGAESGHDWFHTLRVWNNSKMIAQTEAVNLFVVELGALLHDVADSKFHGGDEEISPRIAAELLDSFGVETSVREHVQNIIRHISFKGGNFETGFQSLELAVVQDADRLDAIGAIGIARTFNYGGFKNRAMYDPAIPPNPDMTKEEYKNSTAPTLNHFYEKLLLLKDRMNTQTGRQVAEKRHEFMEIYLKQFFDEWNGVA